MIMINLNAKQKLFATNILILKINKRVIINRQIGGRNLIPVPISNYVSYPRIPLNLYWIYSFQIGPFC